MLPALAIVLSACSQEARNAVAPEDVQSDTPQAQEEIEVAQQTEHAHTNRLIDETSPYLLQHAHNPVDWYPWGEEALQKAKDEDKPIFLSIGYSSCHWCHVMERESFENEEIAALLNEHFVSIKVDREERPDLDEIYMQAVVAMTQGGGWPMSVFLTTDLKPFYGGTYFPPEDRYGRPGFKSLVVYLAKMWSEERAKLTEQSDKLTEYMQQSLSGQQGESAPLNPELIANAVRDLSYQFDAMDGGFGPAPKFPSAPSIALILREYARTKSDDLLEMATTTLDKMAQGGMYDHLGGGFSRYSTDTQWLVPHFEKMLYDNGQLAQIYLEAYQVTKNPHYKKVVEEIFDYVLRDMRDERGGFYSAEDADSEGEEGKFYVWTHEEILAQLGEEDGAIFSAYYNLRPEGNFTSSEHYHAKMNILHTPRPAGEVAEELETAPEALEAAISKMKATLLEVRGKRVRPGLDDKILSSWNALMISAFAQGYQILGDERYREAAVDAAGFIVSDMTRDGELLRTHRLGESRLPAYLDDYAFMILAMVDVYEATFDVKWLNAAVGYADKAIEEFWDEDSGVFYFTSLDHKNLLVRTRPTQDGATPSGNSMAALGLLRLAKLVDNPGYYDTAKRILESNQTLLAQAPRGFLKMMAAVDFMLYPPKEIAIAGSAGSDDVAALLAAVHGQFIPNKVMAFIDPESASAETIEQTVPLLAYKRLIDGKAAAYVCKNFACKLPVTTPEALLDQLAEPSGAL